MSKQNKNEDKVFLSITDNVQESGFDPFLFTIYPELHRLPEDLNVLNAYTATCEAIQSGIRQRFVVLSFQDVVEWVFENYRNFDLAKEIKMIVDSGMEDSMIPEPMLAKFYKYRLLKLKWTFLQQQRNMTPKEDMDTTNNNNNGNEETTTKKKELGPSKDRGKSPAKKGSTNTTNINAAASNTVTARGRETSAASSRPESALDVEVVKRKTKVKEKNVGKGAVLDPKLTVIADEPIHGPLIYVFLKELPSSLIKVLMEELKMPLSAVIGISNQHHSPSFLRRIRDPTLPGGLGGGEGNISGIENELLLPISNLNITSNYNNTHSSNPNNGPAPLPPSTTQLAASSVHPGQNMANYFSKSKQSLQFKSPEIPLPPMRILCHLVEEANEADIHFFWKHVAISVLQMEMLQAPMANTITTTAASISSMLPPTGPMDGRVMFDRIAKHIYDIARVRKNYSSLFEQIKLIQIPTFSLASLENRLYQALTRSETPPAEPLQSKTAEVERVMAAVLAQVQVNTTKTNSQADSRGPHTHGVDNALYSLMEKLLTQTPGENQDATSALEESPSKSATFRQKDQDTAAPILHEENRLRTYFEFLRDRNPALAKQLVSLKAMHEYYPTTMYPRAFQRWTQLLWQPSPIEITHGPATPFFVSGSSSLSSLNRWASHPTSALGSSYSNDESGYPGLNSRQFEYLLKKSELLSHSHVLEQELDWAMVMLEWQHYLARLGYEPCSLMDSWNWTMPMDASTLSQRLFQYKWSHPFIHFHHYEEQQVLLLVMSTKKEATARVEPFHHKNKLPTKYSLFKSWWLKKDVSYYEPLMKGDPSPAEPNPSPAAPETSTAEKDLPKPTAENVTEQQPSSPPSLPSLPTVATLLADESKKLSKSCHSKPYLYDSQDIILMTEDVGLRIYPQGEEYIQLHKIALRKEFYYTIRGTFDILKWYGGKDLVEKELCYSTHSSTGGFFSLLIKASNKKPSSQQSKPPATAPVGTNNIITTNTTTTTSNNTISNMNLQNNNSSVGSTTVNTQPQLASKDSMDDSSNRSFKLTTLSGGVASATVVITYDNVEYHVRNNSISMRSMDPAVAFPFEEWTLDHEIRRIYTLEGQVIVIYPSQLATVMYPNGQVATEVARQEWIHVSATGQRHKTKKGVYTTIVETLEPLNISSVPPHSSPFLSSEGSEQKRQVQYCREDGVHVTSKLLEEPQTRLSQSQTMASNSSLTEDEVKEKEFYFEPLNGSVGSRFQHGKEVVVAHADGTIIDTTFTHQLRNNIPTATKSTSALNPSLPPAATSTSSSETSRTSTFRIEHPNYVPITCDPHRQRMTMDFPNGYSLRIECAEDSAEFLSLTKQDESILNLHSNGDAVYSPSSWEFGNPEIGKDLVDNNNNGTPDMPSNVSDGKSSALRQGDMTSETSSNSFVPSLPQSSQKSFLPRPLPVEPPLEVAQYPPPNMYHLQLLTGFLNMTDPSMCRIVINEEGMCCIDDPQKVQEVPSCSDLTFCSEEKLPSSKEEKNKKFAKAPSEGWGINASSPLNCCSLRLFMIKPDGSGAEWVQHRHAHAWAHPHSQSTPTTSSLTEKEKDASKQYHLAQPKPLIERMETYPSARCVTMIKEIPFASGNHSCRQQDIVLKVPKVIFYRQMIEHPRLLDKRRKDLQKILKEYHHSQKLKEAVSGQYIVPETPPVLPNTPLPQYPTTLKNNSPDQMVKQEIQFVREKLMEQWMSREVGFPFQLLQNNLKKKDPLTSSSSPLIPILKKDPRRKVEATPPDLMNLLKRRNY